jgi:hypothetical protein
MTATKTRRLVAVTDDYQPQPAPDDVQAAQELVRRHGTRLGRDEINAARIEATGR